MRHAWRGPLMAALLIGIALSAPLLALAQSDETSQFPLFPKPALLAPNVEFWKKVFTEYRIGDFVLHDRQNLALVYGVVRVRETASQARAAELAKPEIDRFRARLQAILIGLAAGTAAQELGPDAGAVFELWGCPCEPDALLRAADNIRVQQGLREKVDEGLARARLLLPRITQIFREHDVPVELAALPLVESSFNPRAYSKVGAAGLWQFMRSTGQQYMKVTKKRDDRRDPIRATDGAAHLLKANYQTLGSWPLAIIAYNHGTEGIHTAKAAVGSNAIEDIIAGYTGPRFGFASKNFYAEFLAALEIVHPLILECSNKPAKPQVASRAKSAKVRRASYRRS